MPYPRPRRRPAPKATGSSTKTASSRASRGSAMFSGRPPRVLPVRWDAAGEGPSPWCSRFSLRETVNGAPFFYFSALCRKPDKTPGSDCDRPIDHRHQKASPSHICIAEAMQAPVWARPVEAGPGTGSFVKKNDPKWGGSGGLAPMGCLPLFGERGCHPHRFH